MKLEKTIMAAIGLLFTSLVSRAQESPSTPADLIKNGSLEEDTDADGWPDHWPHPKQATREEEHGNHFIRLKSPAPDATVLMYQKVVFPAGTKQLEFKWKQRVSDLKIGTEVWFDARIMLELRDDADKKVAGGPSSPYTRKSTDKWEERTVTVTIPDGATSFVFMPALFRVEAGTFDIDDFSLRVVEP